MPMPTTRYGRYLYFKRRAMKRLKRVRARHICGGSATTHKSERLFDWRHWGKQEPRVYPLRVIGVLTYLGPSSVPYHVTLPGRRVPPHVVIHWGSVVGGLPESHATHALVGYHQRRVFSLPPLKHIDKLPWVLPQDPSHPEWYYPFDFYPSGRPSYRSTLG